MMLAFYATCLIFVFLVLGTVARLAGFSIIKFIQYIKEELLIVLGTSSSESVLPRMIAKMENCWGRKSQSWGWSSRPATRSTWTAPASI